MNTKQQYANAWFLGLILMATFCHAQETLRGAGRVGSPIPNTYGKSWALLIGINYAGRQEEMAKDPANKRALPQLANAAKDASDLAKVLKEYYEKYDEHTVTLLTDEGGDANSLPTTERIREEISELCEKVKEDDSVLFFFAGHGLRFENPSAPQGYSVSLLPYDVKLSKGQLTGLDKIEVPDELIGWLEKIPAKHKLIILDCCYSGEIFNVSRAFQPRSAASTDDQSLQTYETFQAMVSCRAPQETPDKSKFIASLQDGLKYIPARSDDDRRVWANRLLAYMLPDFGSVSQKPDCRNLIGKSGEFCFFPKEIGRFQPFTLEDEDKAHLKSMVVSRQGNWWFEETPWFIPSIRKDILEEYGKAQVTNRSPSFAKLIHPDELRAAAETVLQSETLATDGRPRTGMLGDIVAKSKRALVEAKNDESREVACRGMDAALATARRNHFHALLGVTDANKRRSTLLEIESDLLLFLTKGSDVTDYADKQAIEAPAIDEADVYSPLMPADLHLLAVAQHALGKKSEAEASYARAIAAYDKARAVDSDHLQPSLHIPAALCHADYAEFLLESAKEPQRAAVQFATAQDFIVSLFKKGANRSEDAAAFFRIFMYCREADAWLTINRWTMANDCLDKALQLAEALAPDHYLQAHVFRRQAWAEIIQWRFAAARSAFARSNEILDLHFRGEAERRGVAVVPVKADSLDRSLGRSTGAPALSPFFVESSDHYSKIAYLHNHHGIAMAQRFQGDTANAAMYYRWLNNEVEKSFSVFRDPPAELARMQPSLSSADIDRQFLLRRINTQERLGDCNLFGDPLARDPTEAVDDYRRALSLVHLLRGDERDQQKGTLLYKQALALSLPSPMQDTDLALEMCGRADQLYSPQKDRATGLWQALGELTSKTVKCIHASVTKVDVSGADFSERVVSQELRTTIESYRDTIGSAPHRDQLELCLFSAKALVEHGGHRDSYQMQADASLLLSFCRSALGSLAWGKEEKRQVESRQYLRPYYDAVMRVKLRHSGKHIKDLLEIQQEATQGTFYIKGRDVLPKLAIYVLDGECHLLVDIPHKQSKCVSFGDLYDVSQIQTACYGARLALPRAVRDSLEDWFREHSTDRGVEWEGDCCWWSDPVRLPRTRVASETAIITGDPAVKRVLELSGDGHFPFDLPALPQIGPPSTTTEAVSSATHSSPE